MRALAAHNPVRAESWDSRGCSNTRRKQASWPRAGGVDVNGLARLLLVCGGRLGGVMGCHGRIEQDRAWAEGRGYLIRHPRPGQPTAATDPAQVPVVLYSGRRVLLCPSAPVYLPAPGAPYVAA